MSSGTGHRAKAHSISGWTAFDLKQRRRKQGLEDNHDSNPYPSLPLLPAPKTLLNKKDSPLDKPFSSLLAPSINSPFKNKNNLPATTSSIALGTTVVENAARGKLKDLHPWADESLIQDVLAGVSNNIDEALSLLDAMVDETDNKNKVFTPPDTLDVSFLEKENMISFINDSLVGNQKHPMNEKASLHLLNIIKSLPIEPEHDWGEDDVYIIHRKDAIRMMRYFYSSQSPLLSRALYRLQHYLGKVGIFS